MTGGTPGKLNLNPRAARSICCALWFADALMLGRSRLSSSHFLPRAANELSLESKSPRLLRSARSMASLNDNGRTVPVALPSGTLLRNGFWVEVYEAGEAGSAAEDS